MVRLILVSIVLSWPLIAHSEVYRWTDGEGNVVFSDTPPPNNSNPQDVQQVEIPPVKTIPALKTPPGFADQRFSATSRRSYTRYSIVQPSADSAIRDNAGNLTVKTSLDPSLQSNDRVILYIDDKVVAEGRQTNFQLSNVERGTHTLHAEVKNTEGKMLIKTQPITFTLLRFSSLHKKNSPNSSSN